MLPLTDLICLILFIWFLFILPGKLFDAPVSFVLEASDGQLLSASIADDGQWRFPAATLVPEKFKNCIVAFEDQRFYKHPGVDVFALARAIRQNIKAGHVVSGGSTLSMQVMRLSRQQKRTVWQKVTEAILSIRLELSYSKDEILKLYAEMRPSAVM